MIRRRAHFQVHVNTPSWYYRLVCYDRFDGEQSIWNELKLSSSLAKANCLVLWHQVSLCENYHIYMYNLYLFWNNLGDSLFVLLTICKRDVIYENEPQVISIFRIHKLFMVEMQLLWALHSFKSSIFNNKFVAYLKTNGMLLIPFFIYCYQNTIFMMKLFFLEFRLLHSGHFCFRFLIFSIFALNFLIETQSNTFHAILHK